MMRHFYRRFLLYAVCAVFISCSDSDIKISYVKAFTVLDYRNSVDKPDARLAVFVETPAGIGRAENIKIKSEKDGFEWVSDNLIKFTNADAQWAACLNFVCPNNAIIPSGSYTLKLTDAEGQDEIANFMIYYPENTAFKNAAELEKSLAGSFREFLASYDEKGLMLSYDAEALAPSAVFAARPAAAYCRRCLELTQGSVYCLMPPIYRDTAE